MATSPTVVGVGEILWDMLPTGRQLGGAPANFAYCSHLLGSRSVVASRVGTDPLGKDIRTALSKAGISDEFIQSDPSQPTGTAKVELDLARQPRFEIIQPVAWDFLEWTEAWRTLAESSAAVCFGSLAQRSAESRRTIARFLDATSPDSLRVFDVNLRQHFYSPEVIHESLKRANVVKLSHEEEPRVRDLLGIHEIGDLAFCRILIDRFHLKLVCVTRGRKGSLLCDSSGIDEHPGFQVKVKDTVGAGDAFTAGLIHGLMQGKCLRDLNQSANRMGAWVASQAGGMPEFPETSIEEALRMLE